MIDPSLLVNESILAVDIGLNGGFCLSDFGRGPQLLEMHNDKKKLAAWVRGSNADHIVAENVHAFEGQGITSTGTLMQGRGFIEGVCATMVNVEPVFVEPLKWIECYTMKRKKHFKTKTDWKKHLLEIAKQQAEGHPLLLEDLNLKTCDAFLLWNWYAHKIAGCPMEKMGFQLKLL